MKKLVIGILAHVDAGKTTLSEGLLYASGALDKLGRVDKRDAFLDTHALERERGITIFSKLAGLEYGDSSITLVDTPGHIDFSCEAERALSVQDYAILIISAQDGVTAHTKTLWHLLTSRRIPTFIFVNKTDIADRRRAQLLDEVRTVLTPAAVDFSHTDTPEFFEACASCDERLMAEFFESEQLSDSSVSEAIAARQVFPCMFGSALKMNGVRELLSVIDRYALARRYPEASLGARIYKISRDPQGRRLTFVKITGGTLRTKEVVAVRDRAGNTVNEKVEEIRIYSGEKFKSASSASAGIVCALLGLNATAAGGGIGFEPSEEQTLTPVLDYRIILPEGTNPYEAYMRLMVLTEEDPSLGMTYDPATHELRVRLMGEIQLEVLERMIRDRFGLAVSFDEGEILYKETVADTVMGAGHFEPLRHYAEVHLRIEPGPEGSGVIAATECDSDRLALNWQRLIMTHIEERVHRGVLTGSPLTDVKITLTAGRAHLKHTEGGDFRQATYRAVRQGLMKATSVLLEPSFDFRIELPLSSLGRAMTDITNMKGRALPPEIVGDTAILEGNCPVATMRSYATELRAYTAGEGKISLSVGEYIPCHNAAEVIEKRGYDPILDERHTPSSVFCKGGAGYSVPWYEADALMHVSDIGAPRTDTSEEKEPVAVRRQDPKDAAATDKELMRIFEATYGKIKPRTAPERRVNAAPEKAERPKKQKPKGDTFVIIDGYNFLFAIDALRRHAERDIAMARDLLVRLMCDYAAFHRCRVIVVFDAYRREGGEGSTEDYGAVTAVYTKEKQTADAYIERATYRIAGEHTVRVVTSDMQEQLVILGAGGLRVSAREFYKELTSTSRTISEMTEFK